MHCQFFRNRISGLFTLLFAKNKFIHDEKSILKHILKHYNTLRVNRIKQWNFENLLDDKRFVNHNRQQLNSEFR